MLPSTAYIFNIKTIWQVFSIDHQLMNMLKVGFIDGITQSSFATSTVDVSNAPVDVQSNVSSSISVSSPPSSTQSIFLVQFPTVSKADFQFNLNARFPPTFQKIDPMVIVSILDKLLLI